MQDKKWASFFAEKRIGWQLQLAKEKGIIFGDIDSIIRRVQQKLSDHQPQPSLLHGDLWPSNCAAVADGGTVAFDPACYWGDRECDLAMLSFSLSCRCKSSTAISRSGRWKVVS